MPSWASCCAGSGFAFRTFAATMGSRRRRRSTLIGGLVVTFGFAAISGRSGDALAVRPRQPPEMGDDDERAPSRCATPNHERRSRPAAERDHRSTGEDKQRRQRDHGRATQPRGRKLPEARRWQG